MENISNCDNSNITNQKVTIMQQNVKSTYFTDNFGNKLLQLLLFSKPLIIPAFIALSVNQRHNYNRKRIENSRLFCLIRSVEIQHLLRIYNR